MYTGAVGSYISTNRKPTMVLLQVVLHTGTKTHFESHCHIDLKVLAVILSSLQVCKCVQPSRVPRPHPRGENGGDLGTRVSGECFISLHSEPAVRFPKCPNHAPCAAHFSGCCCCCCCCWGGDDDCFMSCSGEGEMTRLSVEENAATLSYRSL